MLVNLSEISLESIENKDFIARDGSFEHLGLFNSSLPNLLIFVESEKYLALAVSKLNISAVITTEAIAKDLPNSWGIIISQSPKITFFKIHNWLVRHTKFYGGSFKTQIDDSANIHPTAYIAPMNVLIGRHCCIGPHVVILENSFLKDEVVIGPNSTIGTVGLEYKRDGDQFLKVEHIAKVILHRGVEIQDCSSIAKGIFQDVEIGEHTKIGSLVRVGHEVKIGCCCIIGSHSIISGSAILEDEVWLGVSTTISNGVHIGKQAKVLIGAVVINDVKQGQQVAGNFAVAKRLFFKFVHSMRR